MVELNNDEYYMKLAISASRQAIAEGNFPFGATLVNQDGSKVHVSRNNQVTKQDCTGHAEIVLIREVRQQYGEETLAKATVYASGEPCAMCSGALFWAGVSRVVYAIPTTVINTIAPSPFLKLGIREVLAGASREIKVDGPLMEDEATEVLRRFVEKRQD